MLDPAAPGVTKQMMLDWLRINHPKSPISSYINKTQVAVKVREKQPEFFPDPQSDRPAMFIHEGLIFGVSRNEAGGSNVQLRPPSPPQETKPTLPQPSPDADVALDTPVKRAASPTSSARPTKRSNLSTEELSRRMSSAKKNLKDKKGKKVTFLPQPLQAPTRVVSKSVFNVMEENNQHDIDVLQREAPAMSPLAHQILNSPLAQRDMLDVEPNIQATHDLIDLSDGDMLSVGNLEINVPPLRLPASKVKSGVDVFHEEQARAEKIGVLEASVSELLDRIECVEKRSLNNMAQCEHEKIERVYHINMNIKRLDQQAECIKSLTNSISSLQKKVDKMYAWYDKAKTDLETHELCIMQLMRAENGDDDYDEGSLDQEADEASLQEDELSVQPRKPQLD